MFSFCGKRNSAQTAHVQRIPQQLEPLGGVEGAQRLLNGHSKLAGTDLAGAVAKQSPENRCANVDGQRKWLQTESVEACFSACEAARGKGNCRLFSYSDGAVEPKSCLFSLNKDTSCSVESWPGYSTYSPVGAVVKKDSEKRCANVDGQRKWLQTESVEACFSACEAARGKGNCKLFSYSDGAVEPKSCLFSLNKDTSCSVESWPGYSTYSLAEVECDGNEARCPTGTTPTQVVTPASNGCGSTSFQNFVGGMVIPDQFTSCCDAHDLCYDTAGTKRDACDTAFQQCLDSKSDGFWQSMVGAAMYEAVNLGGQDAFCDAKKRATICS